jgi:hypothetical protein
MFFPKKYWRKKGKITKNRNKTLPDKKIAIFSPKSGQNGHSL